jgi:cytochrome c oxidase cbb3-type subunit 4
MDEGTIRGLFTLVMLVAFLALVAWAWSKRRKADFDKLARMPLDDDPPAEDQGSKTP